MKNLNQIIRESFPQPVKQGAIEIATLLLESLVERVNKDFYHGKGGNLTIGWIPTEAFKAEVTSTADIPFHHKISFSYGVAIQLYQDALLLATFSVREFSKEKYKPIFSTLDNDRYGTGVLPRGLSEKSFKLEMFKLSISWIFFHELSHAFQDHGKIRSSISSNEVHGNSLMIEEVIPQEDDQKITGKLAWIFHATELAADYEGINMTLQVILFEKKTMTPSSLWLLFCGISCIFHRFYGESRTNQLEEAIGTHPDPATRLTLLAQGTLAMLSHEAYEKYLPWVTSESDLADTMQVAIITASMYWSIRNNAGNKFPEILSKVSENQSDIKKYMSVISPIWAEIRPEIMKTYFGAGEGAVMKLAL